MVSSFDSVDLTLFLASESLVLQIMKACGPHRAPVLRVVRSSHPEIVVPAMACSALSIIDATQDPKAAMAILDQAVSRMGQGSVGVYTETAHEGLEIPVRSLGVAYWLGPCAEPVWESIFDGLEAAMLVSGGARQNLDGISPDAPSGWGRQIGNQEGGARW